MASNDRFRNRPNRRLRFLDHLVSARRRCPVAHIRTWTVGLLLLAGVAGLSLPDHAHAATCDAIVGRWAWFIGGEVTVNPDGTFTQQSGNAGTWQCTDAARGRFTFRWRDGRFVNSLALSPDGQGLTSTDQSQWYVTAQRSAAAPKPPQLVRKDNCCQENYACETKRIEAEFTKKMATCHFPGNSGCIAEATSRKASQLKAANENLRVCNRAASGGVTTPVPGAGGAASSPASSDEFHSTEGTGGPTQGCQPCGFGTDQTGGAGGDTFGSDSPGSPPKTPGAGAKPVPGPGGTDGPLPWEQPAEAQTPRGKIGSVSVNISWNSPPNENRDRRQRNGSCSLSIEFYSDGTALVRSYKYENQDTYRNRTFPDQLRLEHIHGGPSEPFQFRSDLSRVSKGNNLYDISWTNPTLDSSRDNYKRLDYPGSQWEDAPGDGSPAYKAYCVGRNPGPVDDSPAVNVRLLNVRLVDRIVPTSPSTTTSTITVNNLQKQVSKARVTMQWSFQQPEVAQQNMPSLQPRR